MRLIDADALIKELEREVELADDWKTAHEIANVVKYFPNIESEQMSETINKASVCEILADIYPTDGEKVVAVKEIDKAYEAILRLPFTQPEIIHCRDCMNWDKTWTNNFAPNHHYCPMVDGVRKDDFYCADAERWEE